MDGSNAETMTEKKRIAVAGATGLIGREVAAAAGAAGYDVQPISRSSGVDLLSGEGLDAALDGADAVIDVSSTSDVSPGAAVSFFEAATTNLLAAGERAGVGHHVVLSIVNVDQVEANEHYAGKRRQEELAEGAGGRASILRATQFFDFPAQVVGWMSDGEEATLAPLLLQPVATADVAQALVEVASGQPGFRGEIAGPSTEDMVDMARRTLAARGEELRLVPTWDGLFGTEMAGKILLPEPGGRIGPTSFEDWLDGQSKA